MTVATAGALYPLAVLYLLTNPDSHMNAQGVVTKSNYQSCTEGDQIKPGESHLAEGRRSIASSMVRTFHGLGEAPSTIGESFNRHARAHVEKLDQRGVTVVELHHYNFDANDPWGHSLLLALGPTGHFSIVSRDESLVTIPAVLPHLVSTPDAAAYLGGDDGLSDTRTVIMLRADVDRTIAECESAVRERGSARANRLLERLRKLEAGSVPFSVFGGQAAVSVTTSFSRLGGWGRWTAEDDFSFLRCPKKLTERFIGGLHHELDVRDCFVRPHPLTPLPSVSDPAAATIPKTKVCGFCSACTESN